MSVLFRLSCFSSLSFVSTLSSTDPAGVAVAVAADSDLVFTDWADVVAVLAANVAVLTNGVVTLSDGLASLTGLAGGIWIGNVNGLIFFAGLFEIAFSSSSLGDSAGSVSTYISNVRYITINLNSNRHDFRTFFEFTLRSNDGFRPPFGSFFSFPGFSGDCFSCSEMHAFASLSLTQWSMARKAPASMGHRLSRKPRPGPPK